MSKGNSDDEARRRNNFTDMPGPSTFDDIIIINDYAVYNFALFFIARFEKSLITGIIMHT